MSALQAGAAVGPARQPVAAGRRIAIMQPTDCSRPACRVGLSGRILCRRVPQSMTYPLSLVNILTVIAASACLWAAVPEAQGKPQKLWRVAVPPFLAMLVALVLLAGAVTSFAHDATWAGTALVGAVAGLVRGRRIGVQTGQGWVVVRPQPAIDGAVIAVGVVAAALLDAVAGFLPQGTLPRQ